MIEFTGYSRSVDFLGRITIPKEIREKFQIRDDDRLDIYIDTERKEIVLGLVDRGCPKK